MILPSALGQERSCERAKIFCTRFGQSQGEYAEILDPKFCCVKSLLQIVPVGADLFFEASLSCR